MRPDFYHQPQKFGLKVPNLRELVEAESGGGIKLAMADLEDACPYEFKGEKSRAVAVQALNTLDFGRKVVAVRPNNLGLVFEHFAGSDGATWNVDRPFDLTPKGDTRYTVAELAQLVEETSAALHEAGVAVSGRGVAGLCDNPLGPHITGSLRASGAGKAAVGLAQCHRNEVRELGGQ